MPRPTKMHFICSPLVQYGPQKGIPKMVSWKNAWTIYGIHVNFFGAHFFMATSEKLWEGKAKSMPAGKYSLNCYND